MLKFLNKINIVKLLQISAVAIFALHFLIPILGFVAKSIQSPFTISLQVVLYSALEMVMRAITGLFQPLVLLALAELIKIKKGK